MSRFQPREGRTGEEDFIVRGRHDRETCDLCATYQGKLISKDKAFELLAILRSRCSSVIGCRCEVLSRSEDEARRKARK